MHAQAITVFDERDNGRVAFHAEAGRDGFAESAELDFLHFASVAIGAVYVVVGDAANRLVRMGARVVIRDDSGERAFCAAA